MSVAFQPKLRIRLLRMKTTMRTATAFLLTLTLSVLTANAENLAKGDAAAGEKESTTCAACHGADGNSVNPLWPSLAGQHSSYVYQQLKAFKSGARSDVLMSSQAMILDDQTMRDLAAFYESKTAAPRAVKDQGRIVAGQRLYRGGNSETQATACLACHGPSGNGNPAAGYPAIGGQHAEYVAKALRDYASEERKSDREQMMRNIASALSDDEITAIASYVQGLH